MLERLKEFLLNKKWGGRLLGILLIFIILFFSFPIYLRSGHIVLGDLDVGFTLRGYIDRILPLFNKTWSTTTFFNGTRLPFVFLIYYVIEFFGDFPSFFEKTIIFSLLFTSAVGMFILVFYILKEEITKKRYDISINLAFLIAISSGIYYSYNPWSIIRIQHIYLLVGYALFPFIYYEIIKFSTNIKLNPKGFFKIDYKNLLHIFLASFYFLIAIGAVHYLFFVTFLFLGWYIFLVLIHIYNKEFKQILTLTYRYFIFGITFLLFIFYWFLPYIGASKIASVNPPSINTIDSISMLARYSTFKNVAYLNSYWWPIMDIDNLGIFFQIAGILILLTILIGNLFNLRNKIVVFCILWTIVFFILSTGTNTPYFARFYKWIVFDNPVAGQLGFIFRDSNKLVGLLAFSYAVLWGTGIAGISDQILKKINYKKKEIEYLRKVFDKVIIEKSILFSIFGLKLKKIRMNNYYVYIIGTSIIFIFSYYFYLNPYYKTYLNHFYYPIQIPSDYKEFIKYQDNDKTLGKYLYLPRYETINTPGYEYAVTNWVLGNEPQRAVGAYDIHSSIKETYNPLEGATPMLGNFYEYIDNYLEKGIGKNLNKYMQMLGISKLIYHKDMYNLDEYQNIQLDNLNKQNLKKNANVGFFNIFENEKFSSFAHFYSNSIYNFMGLTSMESLFNSKIVNPLSYANFFINSELEVNKWTDIEKKGDIIIVDNKLDLILSKIKKENILAPFEYNNYSQTFSRWAKNIENVADWKYHLNKLGIKNFTWDFSLNKGFIFTYAPAMLDLEPFEYVHDKGVDILDFKKLINPSDIIKASDESNITIGVDRTNLYDQVPAIKGEITKGDSKIWKVGILNPINVKEKNSYYFETVISGKNVNSIHGKVKFIDKENKEIGLSYVSAPKFADNFQLIKFSGSFITPVGTKKIIFEINTLQNPNIKSFWFIHDIKIKDMGIYTKENIQKLTYDFKNIGKYKIFTRTFDNIAGGKIDYIIDGKKITLNTKTDKINKFTRHELGNIVIKEIGKKDISINNIKGFNAVNVIVFIKNEDFEKISKEVSNNKSYQMIPLEAESSSNYIGNIQSNTIKNIYSNGKIINFNYGKIINNFDIIKTGKYNLKILTNQIHINSSLKKGDINLVIKKDKKLIYSKKLIEDKDIIDINGIELQKGNYKMSLEIINDNPSIINTQDFNRLKNESSDIDNTKYINEDYSITKNRQTFEMTQEKKEEDKNIFYYVDEPGCSYFNGLDNKFASFDSYKDGNHYIKKIGLESGNSCFWLITSNGLTKIKQDTEYLLSYVINKTNVKYLHSKIMFYNKDKKLLEKQELNINGSIQDSNQLALYDLNQADGKDILNDFIIKTPKNAEYISIQFWQKQRQDTKSIYEIKNFLFKEYDTLPGIDITYIYDNRIGFDSFNLDLNYSKEGTMKRIIDLNGINKDGVVQIGETYNPLWQIKKESGYEKPYITDGFLNSFSINKKQKKAEIIFLPSKYIIPGFTISILTFIFMIILLKRKRNAEKK